MTDRTVTVNCPRCGREETLTITSADVAVAAATTGLPEAQREYVYGLDAEVRLYGAHTCAYA